jgi:hypothetical protein
LPTVTDEEIPFVVERQICDDLEYQETKRQGSGAEKMREDAWTMFRDVADVCVIAYAQERSTARVIIFEEAPSTHR